MASGDVVPAFVNVGFERGDLEELMKSFNEEQIPVVVEWLGLKITINSLVGEISLATGRIVTLVKALKSYTYIRITSYNVCYTKLLRETARKMQLRT